MNNIQASKLLDECRDELATITALLTGYGEGAKPTPYIKKYAVIRATGSIESAFKQIIADRVDCDSNSQVKNFISKKIRNSSCNPNLDMIESMLSEFDKNWRARFDEQIALADKPALKGALTELVKARNSFAHGGAAELSIEKTVQYFASACAVIGILDETVHRTYDNGE